MKIENYGFGSRCDEAMRLLVLAAEDGRLPPWLNRIILLPIPSSRDGVSVSGSGLGLSDIFLDTATGDFIIGYGIKTELMQRARELGAAVYDAASDEKFLLENAELTALGTIGYILTTLGRSPSEVSFGVAGYGRIGKILVKQLLFFGARVKVYTSHPQLCRHTVSAVPLTDRSGRVDLDGIDVFINTAPTDLSASFPAGELPRGLRVIELASGNNFAGVSGVERLPSVPEKSFGKSGGRVYFEGAMRYLTEVNL